MPKLLSASFQIVQSKCQNLCCNNDFDQNDQNRSDHESQNKYCKANTPSSFSIFYTEKLTSPKRRESFLRAVVMKPAGRYICLIVLLNSRVYLWEGLDTYLDLVYLNIQLIAKILRPYQSELIAHHGRCCFSSNFKRVYF